MKSEIYVKHINESLLSQVQNAIHHNGLWQDTQFFTTSLDFGRQSGKTTAAIELMNKGGSFVYVAPNHYLVKEVNSKVTNPEVLFVSARYSENNLDNCFRGCSIDNNKVTVIFDEADFNTSKVISICRSISLAMRNNKAWGKLIHAVRLGY